jgi:predicted membrane channel-forming protein YqfA (hemolysin III family)
MQRKPHPHGLEIFLLSSFFYHPMNPKCKMPYILDCLPHLQVGDVTTGNLFALLRQR